MTTIRPLASDLDWDQYVDLSRRAFGPQDESSIRSNTEPVIADGRALGAFDGDRLTGTALFHDMRQWWYGRAVPMAGVAGVKIAPEDRGRGTGRALMTALTALMAERGYPLTVLYPATMPIYRSLGWEIAGRRQEVRLPGRSLYSLGKPATRPGPVPLRRPGPGDAAEVLEVLGRSHTLARECGPVTFDEATVRRRLTRPGRYADSDRYAYLAPDGFAGYRWQHGYDEIFVDRVVAASAQTTQALWGVIASHSSVAQTVRAQLAPADPLWWLLREQDVSMDEGESWMLRLLDAPAAIAARGFPPADITVPLDITDDTLPANSGHWELTVRAGAGSLSSRTGRVQAPGKADPRPAPPPLTLGARGLAALYAGTPVPTLRRAGLASGGTSETDAALDAAFAATPYMLDAF